MPATVEFGAIFLLDKALRGWQNEPNRKKKNEKKEKK
jgi:hypothetical protein